MRHRIGYPAKSRLAVWFAVLVVAGAAGACTASTSPSAAPAVHSNAPTAGPAATPPASPTAGPAAFVPPTLPPAGTWTGIKWTRLPDHADVWAKAPVSPLNVTDFGWNVVGWSHGYLAFDAITTSNDDGSWRTTTETSHSADGVLWQPGGSFTVDGGATSTNNGVSGVASVVEGPAGLLAISSLGVACGWPNSAEYPVAISRDGTTWVPIAPGFHYPVTQIDGGPTGYIAASADGVFTSTDGATWTKANLSGKEFHGLDAIEGGAAFAGGYVMSGETKGPATGDCGTGPTLLTPSLWWSADGHAWTRDQVPSPVTGSSAVMQVWRLDDRTLIANEAYASDTGIAYLASWRSHDGRVWVRTKVPWKNSANLSTVGKQIVMFSNEDPTTACLPAYAVSDDLSVTKLAQIGVVPSCPSIRYMVSGPTGLITVDETGATFVGVPISG